MNRPLHPNTQAILLLTAPLLVGKRQEESDRLGLADYNRLARALRERKLQPGDLLARGASADEAKSLAFSWFGRERTERLLGRGFLLSQAVEQWTNRAIWVISRADPSYPRRLKTRFKEDAPPVLYGVGDPSLLDAGGLAVVGSRHVNDDLLRYTQETGALAARAGVAVVSGGARGVDQAAMAGGLEAGGTVVGVLADSLERAAILRDFREPLMSHQLVLISPYDPAAGFNVGHAMQRNKLIYALADAALVISSEVEKGGTWAGAIEQLERFHFGPVFVRNGTQAPAGNLALLRRGAHPWPEPTDSATLAAAIRAAIAAAPIAPPQETLSFTAQEAAPDDVASEPAPTDAPPVVTPAASPEAATPAPSSVAPNDAAERLFAAVRPILLAQLRDELTETELADRLAVNKAQAKAWLARLVASAEIAKVKKSKPARYRADATQVSLGL